MCGFVRAEREREGDKKKVHKTLNTKNSLGKKVQNFCISSTRREDTRSTCPLFTKGGSTEGTTVTLGRTRVVVVVVRRPIFRTGKRRSHRRCRSLPWKSRESKTKGDDEGNTTNRYEKMSSGAFSSRWRSRGMEWHGMRIVRSRVD